MKKAYSFIACAALAMSAFAASNAPITEVDGVPAFYDRVAYGWYIYAGGANLQYGRIPGSSQIVTTDNGKAYIYNPLTADAHDSYIECTVDGNKMTAQFPQVLAILDDGVEQFPLYIGKMQKQDNEDGTSFTYVPVSEGDTYSWIVDDDKVTLDAPEVPLDEFGKIVGDYPEYILGTYYFVEGDPVGVWNAVGDWAQTYTKIETKEITTLPEGLTTEKWQLSTKEYKRMINVAIDGDKIYLLNLSQYSSKGACVVGTIADGKASFPTNQYLGMYKGKNTPIWFISAFAEYEIIDWGDYTREYLSKFNRTAALEFTYDAEAKLLTSEKNACYIINASTGETNYYEYQVDPQIEFLSEAGMDAAPQNPTFVACNDEGEPTGFEFRWDIPAVNVNNVKLNTENMFFRVYVNGELYTFYPDTYPSLTQEIFNVPYDYNDNRDFVVKGTQHSIYFHAAGIENVGIVSCFKGSNGNVYKSDVVNSDPEWGGISDIATDDNGKAAYYDLQGRPLSEPAQGISICIKNGKATKVVRHE